MLSKVNAPRVTTPGVATTEFWLSLFVAIVGFLPTTGILDYLPQRTGAYLLLGSQIAYVISRGLAKVANFWPTPAPTPTGTRAPVGRNDL